MKSAEKPLGKYAIQGIEGAILTVSPLPFLFLFIPEQSAASLLGRTFAALISAFSFIACAGLPGRNPRTGKMFGVAGVVGLLLTALPVLLGNPFVALTAAVLLIGSIFFILDLSDRARFEKNCSLFSVNMARSHWAAYAALITVIISALITINDSWGANSVVIISTAFAQMLLLRYAFAEKKTWRFMLLSGYAGAACLFFLTKSVAATAVAANLAALFLTQSAGDNGHQEKWWVFLLNHPARLMLSTFLLLCISGVFLLLLPVATVSGSINPIDAMFTAVSCVCVTGLTVIDITKELSFQGQLFMLLLIQSGGLGIMTIATVALHMAGGRMSLQQERVMISITDTDHRELFGSLKKVVLFTFALESAGALLLAILFYQGGDVFAKALWGGVFTAVSAFCNAGFALQSDNLAVYNLNPLVLNVVATLIILGGIAPSTCLLVPRWLCRKPVPVTAHLALVTTCILLVAGTVMFLVFEWNGILAPLPAIDKIHNAFFQSATLRTAGFNSVPLAGVAAPTCLCMILFMFIGGSPGGTAGGIKTTTFGVLVLTFWANITNHGSILLRSRRLPFTTVQKAVTITFSGCIVWMLAVVMLLVTQQISARDIIFEVTSALGTVGLSIGATPMLDEIGKIIIMMVMFIGRIGPMTLFMLLGREQASIDKRCPDAKITMA